MSALIGALRVSLSADTANFEAGMKRAQRQTQASASAIEKSLGTIKAGLTGLAAGFTVGFLAEQIKKSLDYAGSLKEVSRTLGVTTKDLQTFRFAASQSGVSQDELEVGLRRLTVSMGKAQLGSAAQAKAFNAIGISLDQIKGKNTGDVFRLMADGLSKVSDRSQRAAVEMSLMGRSGSTLDNLLAPGSKRLNELAEAAQRLGIVLSDSQIQGAEETAHKLEAVKEVLAAQIAGVVADNANAILALSSSLAALTGEILRFLGSNPQLALGIIGALAGGRVGGPIGAAIGAVGGAYVGKLVAQSNADSNMDIRFRQQQFHNAKAAYAQAKSAPDVGGRVLPGVGTQASEGGAKNVAAAFGELKRQYALFNQAVAQTKASRGSGPQGADLPKFLAGDNNKKPKRAPEDRSEEVSFQFAQEERRADMDILQAKMDLSHNADERAKLALQMLDLEKEARDAEIDHRVNQAQKDYAEHRITKSTLDEVVAESAVLKAKGDEADRLKAQAIVEEQAAQKARDTADLKSNSYDLQVEQLQLDADLTTTAKERRAVELRILDVMKEQEKARLEAVIADKDSSDLAKKEAQARLDKLDSLYGSKKQGVMQNTRDPLEQWAATVPQTSAQITEALQGIEANGLDGIANAMAGIVSGTESMGEAFQQVAKQMIAEITMVIIKMLLLKAIQAATGAMGGGFGGSASLDMGTSAVASGASGVDPGLFGSLPGLGLATGGFVSGPGSPTSDSIPAMLSNGEFVMNAKAVGKFGPMLAAMNAGRIPHAKGGGLMSLLGGFLPALAGGALSGNLIPGSGAWLFKKLGPFGLMGKALGFANGGMVHGLPIARGSMGGGMGGIPSGGMGGAIVINQNFSGTPTRETMNQVASRTRGAMAAANRAGV